MAFGDVHGDIQATRAALALAGAIGQPEPQSDHQADHWIGGDLVVVQTGDQLDRGDGERAILDLLERLSEQAAAAGGALLVLNGNHEVMNVAGDLRYVSPEGFAEFADIEPAPGDARLLALEPRMRGRAAAFQPGGPYARVLARRNTIAVVGDTVFVHGGVLPAHVERGIESINERARVWMRGDGDEDIGSFLMSPQSPIWIRRYSTPPEDCAALERTLEALAVARMVVGHTAQKEGINSACDGRVWRIDVGMSAYYGVGPVEVLEIEGDRVRVIAAGPAGRSPGQARRDGAHEHRVSP